jgi:AraC-like DNA-binding protein
MQEAYFEEENGATREDPYLDIARRNLGARAHIHTELEVICVISGAVEAVIGGKTYTIGSGEICIVMPWVPHSYSRSSGTESVSHVMKLYASEELMPYRLNDPVIAPSHPHYTDIRIPIDTIVSEACAKTAGYAYAIAAQASMLHMAILRYLEPIRVTGRIEAEAFRNRRFLYDFDRFLELHYADPITLDGAAASMHYSRFYFAHRFTEITGQSFLDYVTLFRLEKARTLLENGSSVLDTALLCGFGCTRSFSRAFRKHFGCAPSSLKPLLGKTEDRA